LFIRVSKAPECKGLSVKIFQGSPTFEWDCVDPDYDGFLTYKFSLVNEYGYSLSDTTLTGNSLQLGYALQLRDRIHLTAVNKYGIKTHLDSLWGLL